MQPKFIYLMIAVPNIFLTKIGITSNIGRRKKQISDKIFGWAIPVWVVWIPWAFSVEQQLHGFFHKFNSRNKRRGKEWFWTFPVLPLAWIILNFMFLALWFPVWGVIYLIYINL